MSIIVKKFGGTSVGSLARIQAVGAHILRARASGQQLVIVVSAMQGETDRLMNLAYELCETPEPRELAALVTTGEQVSMSLLAMFLCQQGVRAKSYQASQLGLTTTSRHEKAHILHLDTAKIQKDLAAGDVVIVAGFQGVSEEGDVTTLGRGGSDTTAVALAAALHAEECQIYTDVEGVYTADPRLVPQAYRQAFIPFEAMLTLAHLGSKVLQWRSVALAGKYRIPLRVLSSFKEGEGTLIRYEEASLESPQLVGLSHQLHLKRWQIMMPAAQSHGASLLAETLAANNIHLESLQQIQVGDQRHVSLILTREESDQGGVIIEKLAAAHGWLVTSEAGLARLSLVGMGVRSHAWVAEAFLKALREVQVEAKEWLYSDLALSVLLSEPYLSKAAQKLHRDFFEQD